MVPATNVEELERILRVLLLEKSNEIIKKTLKTSKSWVKYSIIFKQ
jgi:hypothetical protein